MNAICTNDHGFCIVYNTDGTFPKFNRNITYKTWVKILKVDIK